jgi:hypothetical protein
MKTINFILIIALAIGFMAFAPQANVAANGTVVDVKPSGQDSGSCDSKLQTGFAVVYVNGELISGCTAFMQKATSYPKLPGDFYSFISYPINVFFNMDVTPQVTVCYPTKPKNQPEAIGQIFKLESGLWIQQASYTMDGMTCADSFGGGTFGYFGY